MALAHLPGDTRPGYVETVRASGGQAISIGPARGNLNVLDPGEALEAANQLRDAGKHAEYEAVMGDALARITTMVNALLALSPPSLREQGARPRPPLSRVALSERTPRAAISVTR